MGLTCLLVQAQDKGQVEVSGTVLNSLTGQPLAGALVVLRDNAPGSVVTPALAPNLPSVRGPRTTRAVTDVSGGFSFRTEQPLSLEVSRQGFRSADDRDAAIVNINNENARDIQVRLTPLGTISGRVVNEDGEPLQGITVQAVRLVVRDGEYTLEDYATKTTDDRGEYRLWYLSPGSYYLKARGRQATLNGFSSAAPVNPLDPAYGPVYYPNSLDQAGAQALRLTPGQTIGADFSLQGHIAHQIRGVLANLPPRRTISVRLLRGEDPAGNRSRVNLADGSFVVADVTPGSYTLQAYTPDVGPFLMGEVPVTVGGGDLTGVSVPLGSGVDVSIHIDVPVIGPDEPQPFLTVQALPVNSRASPRPAFPAIAVPQPGGGWTLKGLLPGRYRITVTGSPRLYVASISADNVDVLTEGLSVTAAGAPEVRITMQTGAGWIHGTIDGPIHELWTVAVVSVSGQQPTLVNSYQNTFQTGLLPSGDYNVYVWPSSRSIAYREPAVLSSLAAYATFVSLKDGDMPEITLKPVPPEAIP